MGCLPLPIRTLAALCKLPGMRSHLPLSQLPMSRLRWEALLPSFWLSSLLLPPHPPTETIREALVSRSVSAHYTSFLRIRAQNSKSATRTPIGVSNINPWTSFQNQPGQPCLLGRRDCRACCRTHVPGDSVSPGQS